MDMGVSARKSQFEKRDEAVAALRKELVRASGLWSKSGRDVYDSLLDTSERFLTDLELSIESASLGDPDGIEASAAALAELQSSVAMSGVSLLNMVSTQREREKEAWKGVLGWGAFWMAIIYVTWHFAADGGYKAGVGYTEREITGYLCPVMEERQDYVYGQCVSGFKSKESCSVAIQDEKAFGCEAGIESFFSNWDIFPHLREQ